MTSTGVKEKCVHRWVLPTPDGREIIPETCRLCGETRLRWAAWDDTRQPIREAIKTGVKRTGKANPLRVVGGRSPLLAWNGEDRE